jgi:ATP-binding cassette subfamily B protein
MKFIQQKDMMDCGSACLAMIANHYGMFINLETIRQDCALGKDGVSLLGISKAAEKIGFKTVGG